MKTDLTRNTFKLEKHFSSVRMQQGRVQLDADWNEQIEIALQRERTEAADLIGASGAPADTAGFEITVQDNDLKMGVGHYYVYGILCVNESADGKAVSIGNQPDLTNFDLAK